MHSIIISLTLVFIAACFDTTKALYLGLAAIGVYCIASVVRKGLKGGKRLKKLDEETYDERERGWKK